MGNVLDCEKEVEVLGCDGVELAESVEISGKKCIIMVSVEEIMPNRAQPRRLFDNVALEELAKSIEEYGVIQPIVVRKCEDLVGSVFKYELVAGERRLRAAKLVGLAEIPCVFMDVDEKESAELAIIENLHRKDLNIFETAAAISSLIELYGLTQEEIARKLSVTQSAIANKLRLLRFSDLEKRIILENNLTERHARCLLRISDEGERRGILGKMVDKGFNVKEAEEYVEWFLGERLAKKECSEYDCVIRRVKNSAHIIQKAIDKLRKAGCETKSTCTETDDFYIYTITVDK